MVGRMILACPRSIPTVKIPTVKIVSMTLLKTSLRATTLFSVLVLAAACSLTPEPLTGEERQTRVQKDLALMYAETVPVTGPVSLEEAMARAIKFNLDRRVELMNDAVANHTLELARYDLLPKVVAGGGYNVRSNESASSSLSYEKRSESLELSLIHI